MEIVANYEDTANVSQNYIHLNETEDSVFSNSKITFHGTGNVLFVEDGAKLMGTQITFFWKQLGDLLREINLELPFGCPRLSLFCPSFWPK